MQAHASCPRPPVLRQFATALTAVALAACVGADATGPDDQEKDKDFNLEITLFTVTSNATCEEPFTVLDGGEFIWQVAVTWPNGARDVLDATDNYPSPSSFKTLRQGQPLSTGRVTSNTIRSTVGTSITLSLRASEIDFDIFGGNPRPDLRMDNLLATVPVAYGEFGWREGDVTVRVQPSAACNLDAFLTVKATEVTGK